MIFFADSAEVRFDTVIDWQDDHRLLKVAFDTNVTDDFARHEIQFGHVKRPTTRNNSIEEAMFEVVNHKFTDISETRFGAAVLNDSKYGISVEGGNLRLSLHKGGNRPDIEGDKGIHKTVYSFLPHDCGFSSEAVVKPAYELNVPVIASKGDFEAIALVVPENDNIIVEAIKPCEDNEKAFIARLYETEGTQTNCAVKFFDGSNIFTSNDLYLVAYLELYKNNDIDEDIVPKGVKFYGRYPPNPCNAEIGMDGRRDCRSPCR